MKKETKGIILLLITALIWGMAFVAQSSAMDKIDSFTFMSVRFFIGFLSLMPVILVRNGIMKKKNQYQPMDREQRKLILVGGLLCGLGLFGGSALQQVGIALGAETGKAGFLTALYILIVPILGIFLKKKVGLKVWLCVFVAVVGVFFLSVKKGFQLEKEDILLIGCAFAFSFQIMFVDYYSPKVDGVVLSAIQFVVVSLISTVLMFTLETPRVSDILAAMGPILFAGIMSSGVAYTLQIIAQRYAKPTEASLIMSLESAFALLGGMIILHQKPTVRETIGMALMFVAIMVSQIEFKKLV